MTDELVEIAANLLAPFVCMPVFNGDCDDIAAGQSHARFVADKLLAAVTPAIEARVTGEIVAWLQELATHTTKYSPTTIADNIESGHFAHWAETQRRGDRARRPQAGEPAMTQTSWLPISSVPSQEEVLVCNDCYLGWWAVAIQNAFGGWECVGGEFSSRLKYPPTHWQPLPSIYPIGIRGGAHGRN